MAKAEPDVACSCYGCTIERRRAGMRLHLDANELRALVDRSSASCDPPEACATHGRCWTHSEWVDEAACDPPNACVNQLACGAHGKART